MSDWAAYIKRLQGNIRMDVLTGALAVLVLYIVLGIVGIGCPIRWVTGISCAGCGMTRSYWFLLHLDIKQAFIYHPLFWSVPLVLLVFVLHRAGKISAQKTKCVMYLTAFLFLVVYTARMLNPEDIIVTANIKEGLIGKAVYAVRKVFV